MLACVWYSFCFAPRLWAGGMVTFVLTYVDTPLSTTEWCNCIKSEKCVLMYELSIGKLSQAQGYLREQLGQISEASLFTLSPTTDSSR